MKVGPFIQEYCSKWKVKPAALARKAGLDRQNLHAWMKKGDIPTPEKFQKLLKAMTHMTAIQKQSLKNEWSLAWNASKKKQRMRDKEKTALFYIRRLKSVYSVECKVRASLISLDERKFTNLFLDWWLSEKRPRKKYYVISGVAELHFTPKFKAYPLFRFTRILYQSLDYPQIKKWEQVERVTSINGKDVMPFETRPLFTRSIKIPYDSVPNAMIRLGAERLEEEYIRLKNAQDDESIAVPRILVALQAMPVEMRKMQRSKERLRLWGYDEKSEENNVTLHDYFRFDSDLADAKLKLILRLLKDMGKIFEK